MRRLARNLLTRQEVPVDAGSNVKAGIGAAFGIGFVGWLASMTGLPLLLAPLGATAGLLFGQPSSPLSQPINVMGGYLIGTVVCEAAFFAFPGEWVAAAVAVGLTIMLTRALRVSHSPAAALPILGFGQGARGTELFIILFIGCVVLIALAMLVHNLPPRREYPHRTS